MRSIFVSLLLSLCTWLVPLHLLADDFRDGIIAYNKRDFSRALTLWLPLAEQDNPLAQTLVGAMYAYGEGSERDDVQAVKWFTRAAMLGSAQAQYNLGIMYEQGFGVAKDLDQARRWLLAAAEQGREEARQRLDTLSASLAPATAVEQPPTPAPVPDVETEDDALAKPSATTITLNTQSASLAPATVVEQPPTPAPVPDIETEDDALANPPPITITLDTLFASVVVEQKPRPVSVSDLEAEDDALTNPPAITIRFDTLFASPAPPSAGVEQTQPPAHAAAPVPDIETKADELLGPPGIEAEADELLGPPDIDNIEETGGSLDWLQGQPANYYTIQLAASIEKRLVDARMKDIPLTDKLAKITSRRNGQIWYAIVYGSFANFNDAKRALDALPEVLRSWQPWIRSFASIKQFEERK